MFYGRMETHTVRSPQKVTDAYNHTRLTWTDPRDALIHIVVQDRTESNMNELGTYDATLVGYTYEDVEHNDEIDEKWRVTSVMPHRDMSILYLQEVNDGR